jgi:hypothetical protein
MKREENDMPVFTQEEIDAAVINEQFKEAFKEALEDTANVAVAFAVGVVAGDKGKQYVLDLDKDPTDRGANLVAFRLGIKVAPLVMKWIMDVVFRNLPVK